MASGTAWVKGEGFKIDVDISEIKNTLNNMRSYDTKTQATIERAVDNARKNIENRAQSKAPAGTTRKLKKSIKSHFDEKKATGTVYTKRPTAHLMENGVAASTAMPKTKKVLKVDYFGIRRFYPQANIPPRAARPFMKPAFEEERPALIAAIKRAVAKL